MNDDRMGRMLDTLHAAGVTREARKAFPFPVRALRADATSFHWTLEGFSWILRVPATLKEARALLKEEFPREAWTPLLPGYRGVEVECGYGGVR